MAPTSPRPANGDPSRRIGELSTLYEIARALLGARDRRQAAERIVLAGLGALGVSSGALFLAQERGRYRLAYAAGLDDERRSDTLVLPEAAREWILHQGAFPLTDDDARVLGPAGERLKGDFTAAAGVAIPDTNGLLALLVFGPRLAGGSDEPPDWTLLDSIGALASQALSSLPEPERSERARGAARPARSIEALRREHPALRGMVGESPALLEVCQDLVSVAGTRFPVLLTGESGVGKEVAARAIHTMSDRSGGPFETVDCGSIPHELIESELFGHVRGAFTGAHRDRRGAFEMAHRGTLFLDEIGDMPLQLQTRLLRVLQEGRFRRVGGESLVEVDVRVVAATNRDLWAEVAAKRFREDLYYRLDVFAIRVPPLRERAGDLVPLLRHFLVQQGRDLGVPEWTVDRDVVEALESHAWPGNVRELANLSATLTVRARAGGHITLADLEAVWRRQHAGEEPPWAGGRRGGGPARRGPGRRGEWVLELARAARFNLVEAERMLKRRRRAGQPVPVGERTALSYYLTGEILRALAEASGDTGAATRAVAGDEDLVRLAAPRVRKVAAALRAAGGDGQALRSRFGKLPAGYGDALRAADSLLRAR